MNGFQIAIHALIIACVVLACRYPYSTAVRAFAIFFICFVSLLGYAGLLTCSRAASEIHFTFTHQAPSDEWMEGARATRDAVYRDLPLLIAAFAGLGLVAATPWHPRSRHSANDRKV